MNARVMPSSESPLFQPGAAACALQVFSNIADRWGLTESQRLKLLGMTRTTYYRRKQGASEEPLDANLIERLGYVVSIYGALQILFQPAERADAWIKKPSSAPIFGGRSALDRMLGGQVGDLKVVADYLNAYRGGDFA